MTSSSPLPARHSRDQARALLRQGVDPSVERASRKAAQRRDAESAFPKVAAAWLTVQQPQWADETYRKAKYVVEEYLNPALRRESIDTLSTKAAAETLAQIAKTALALALALAAKARQYLSGIVLYAIRTGLREDGNCCPSGAPSPGAKRATSRPLPKSPTPGPFWQPLMSIPSPSRAPH